MNLPSVTNAPRVIVLDGASYRARTLTLAQIGEVLAWLEDRLPRDDARDGPPLFSGEASRLALATTEGLAVILHLSLLSCHPTLTRDRARTLAATMTVEDESRLLSTAFRRGLVLERTGNRPPKDLTEVNWGEIFESLTDHRADAYERVAAITLDQFDNFVSRGEAGDEGLLSPAEVQALWEAAPGLESLVTGDASNA
ncbi:hypothetical protein V5E97_10150 [Singulisphaera sp. Ch08]|uniref:Uncharacterized protein n=1 Tax=Singulisphaera sp. Ch08 TaxID=3120278 RepID=A0AAU7CMP9_9BACT